MDSLTQGFILTYCMSHALRFNHDSSVCLPSLSCVHHKSSETLCHILCTMLHYKMNRTSDWEWPTEKEKDMAKAIGEISFESFMLQVFEGILSSSTNLYHIHFIAPQ